MKNNIFLRDRVYPWLLLLVLWMICVLNYADRQVITAIFPLLEKQFHFTKGELGLIGSSFMWCYAAFALIAAYSVTRFSKKKLLLFGFFFWSFMTLLTTHAFSLWQFIVFRGLEGLGEAFYFPSAMSLLSRAYPKRRSTAFGIHNSGVYLGIVLGSWGGAWMAEHYGWRSGFFLLGGLGMTLSLLFLYLLRFLPRDEEEVTSSWSFKAYLEVVLNLFRNPTIALMVLVFALENSVGGIVFIWMPYFLYKKFHLSLTLAGFYAVAFIQIASLISAWGNGFFADFWHQRKEGGRTLVGSMNLFLACLALLGVAFAPSYTVLFPAMFALGLFRGGYGSGMFAALFDYTKSEDEPVAVGAINTFGWLGGAVGALLFGILTHSISKNSVEAMTYLLGGSGLLYLCASFLLFLSFLKGRNYFRSSRSLEHF